MNDMTPYAASSLSAPPNAQPSRLPAHQLLDRMAPITALSETLRAHQWRSDEVQRIEAAVNRAQALIDNGAHRKASNALRHAMAPATTREIKDAITDAVQACPTVPAGLDVAAYSRQLMADIADVAPSRIDFALAMIRLRFTSRYLPTTADICDALDTVRSDAIVMPDGLQVRPPGILKAIEALPERVEKAREWLAGCQRRLDHQATPCAKQIEASAEHRKAEQKRRHIEVAKEANTPEKLAAREALAARETFGELGRVPFHIRAARGEI